MNERLSSSLLAVVVALAACASPVFQSGQQEASPVVISEEADASLLQPDTEAIASSENVYTIVDTNQTGCYDDADAISCSEMGESYYGQDAQYSGNEPSYTDNGDGTVTDNVTGLTWIQDVGEKVGYNDGIASIEGFEFAGYDDWRVPTIKELYSLMDFSGIDNADAGTDPFIDRDYFVFEYGDTSAGDRSIDSQWITSSIYVNEVMDGQQCFFGVNFADGRIKCYPTESVNNNGYFLRLVRGDSYGFNDFEDSGNGTISDLATGLMWQQGDSGEGMDWPSALNYCESLPAGGYDDWRLPNAKELQSIVDYSRSPETSDSAAIDPIFGTTEITNEAGKKDYAFYWSSTTHVGAMGGNTAVYVSFGRTMGYMRGNWIDVHGAGAQRSDPKSGSASDYPEGRGPQGDAIRIEDYVRCVREGVSDEIITGGEVQELNITAPGGGQAPSEQGSQDGAAGGLPNIDLESAAQQLGVSVDELIDALGDERPPDLAAAAAKLGVSVDDLINALGVPGGPPGN